MNSKFFNNRGLYLGMITFLLVFQVIVFAEVTKVQVKVKWANVREKPALESPVITRISRESILQVLAVEGEWFKVQLDRQPNNKVFAGYIHQQVVRVVEEKEQPLPQVKPQTKPSQSPETKAKAKPVKKPAEVVQKTPAKGPASLVKAKDMIKLQQIADKMRNDSVAFLTLVKKMLPQDESGYRMVIVEIAKVVDNCQVYETEDTQAKVIYNPRLNDEFEILESREQLHKIQLQDGRQGWIKRDCVQVIAQQRRGEKISLTGIKKKDVRKFVTVATDIYSRISIQKEVAEGIVKKYRVQPGNRLVFDRLLRETYSRIQKYHHYSLYFYMEFVKDQSMLLGKKTLDSSRISAWGELLLGTSAYTSNYLMLGEEKNSGLTRSISLGGDLVINKKPRANLNISNRRDIIQTPFNTTSVEAGYFTSNKKLKINGGIHFNTYGDEANDLNDFSRLNVRARADYDLNAKTDLFLNYSFLNHTFNNDGDNDYSAQAFFAGGRYLLNPASTLELGLRSNFESSDSAFHKFSNILPSLTYSHNSANNRFKAKVLYETLSFAKVEVKNFNRAMLWLNNRNSKNGLNSRLNFAFTYKAFPNNGGYDYVQLWGEYASFRFGSKQRSSSISFYSNLFTKDSTNSFTDVKFNFGHTSSKFFTQFSTFFKIWHNPRLEDGSGLVRPYVFDVYLNLGINTPNIRLGPTFGLRFLLSSEKGVKVFAREGNVLRVGANCEIRVPLPKRILLQVNGSYEYGSVYHNELGVNNTTGFLTLGEVLQRHPTTMQVNSILTVPLAEKFELVGRMNYYMINTDMDQLVSINPVEYNRRFLVLLGVRYRTH